MTGPAERTPIGSYDLFLRRSLLAGDRAALALVRARVRMSPLTSYREPSPVPESAIAPDIHEALDVHRTLSTQSTLDLEIPFDLTAKSVYVVVIEILCPTIGIHAAGRDDLMRAGRPDSVDVGERDFNALSLGEINTSNTCHFGSALALFVLGITRADDSHHALSADDLTVLADRFYAASDLHEFLPIRLEQSLVL